MDVVPARQADNLDRLAEALNLLRPRWRVERIPRGPDLRIDGGLEARHFSGDSAAIGLVTRLGAAFPYDWNEEFIRRGPVVGAADPRERRRAG